MRSRQVEDFARETPSEAGSPRGGSDLDSDLADPLGPSRIVEMDAGVACDLAVDLGQQSDSAAFLDMFGPLLDNRRIGDVGAEKEQIVRRQAAGELQNQVGVGAGHEAHVRVLAVGKRQIFRIVVMVVFVRHDLSPAAIFA